VVKKWPNKHYNNIPLIFNWVGNTRMAIDDNNLTITMCKKVLNGESKSSPHNLFGLAKQTKVSTNEIMHE
jgi:hypothetical protein